MATGKVLLRNCVVNLFFLQLGKSEANSAHNLQQNTMAEMTQPPVIPVQYYIRTLTWNRKNY